MQTKLIPVSRLKVGQMVIVYGEEYEITALERSADEMVLVFVDGESVELSLNDKVSIKN